MLELLSKFVCAMIISMTGFVVLKKLLKSDEKLLNFKNICLLFLITLPTLLFYKSEYYISLSLLTYFFTTFIYKNIFRLNLIQSFLSTGILMIIISLSDMITSIMFINITTVEQMRSCWYIMLLSNLCVAIIAVIVSNFKTFPEKIGKLINRITPTKVFNNIIFIVLLIIVISTLFYNVSETFSLSSGYIINIAIMLIFFALTYFYLIEQYNYDKLSHEYDVLFDYVEHFEEWIETEQLNRHELKNSLGAMYSMTKNKKILEKIDSILKDNISIEDTWIEELKSVPKGVLKGLLYYKMAIARNKNLRIVTDVSSKSSTFLKRLKKTDLKDLTQLVGIFLDNALEAAEQSTKKQICLEIYVVDNNLNLVISNTYSGNVKLEYINKKGISTKGKGRGNGLYFAQKIVNRNDSFQIRQQIINNYFVEKIIIESKKNNC